MTDFIEVYSDVLSRDSCKSIVERFESSGQATRGRTGSGVDTKLKDSHDILISGRPEWRDIEGQLKQAAFNGLAEYVRKYPFTLIAPLALRYEDTATGQVHLVNLETFPQVPNEQFVRMLQLAFRPGTINLQKYIADQGGYPYWHCEVYPRDPKAEELHRVLLYTFYLNDVPEAGETEFYFQGRTIAPRAGSLLIAPGGFTHTHRGNTPRGGDKYIATSWILFQRAEQLFAGPSRPPG